MRRVFIILAALLTAAACFAQGPVLRAPELLTYAYEDCGDILRLYPGMYALDYGTLGAPLVFRPWGGRPWEWDVTRDGIPQTRRYDGQCDANLQPVSELEQARLDFLHGAGVGTFSLTTRTLPADTPYTELQIREGFYGYGTVDFAHGQRVYRSTTLEITGRLGWYNGRRTEQLSSGLERSASAARLNRLRGRAGFDIGPRWRGELTYAGSRLDAEFIANDAGQYTEREEGILRVRPADSAQTRIRPELNVFLRQDREKWESEFRAREASGGYAISARIPLARQTLMMSQTTMAAEINFPGMDRRRELIAGAAVTDSINFEPLHIVLRGAVQREGGWRHDTETDHIWLTEGGATVALHATARLTPYAGASYAERAVPVAWRAGTYRLAARPVIFAPEFADNQRTYRAAADPHTPMVDRFFKSMLGARWMQQELEIDAAVLNIARPGEQRSHFETAGDTIRLAYGNSGANHDDLGLAAVVRVPLGYGLRLESQWFEQYADADFARRTERRGFSRVYFEREFFQSPLIVRSHLSHEHIGRRWGFSDRGQGYLNAANVWGLRISATIRGVSLIWGTENLFKQRYQMMPGYWMIGKEEYLAFQWRLLL